MTCHSGRWRRSVDSDGRPSLDHGERLLRSGSPQSAGLVRRHTDATLTQPDATFRLWSRYRRDSKPQCFQGLTSCRPIEQSTHILGMTSSVRGSIRRVHTAGAAAGVAHITKVLGPRLAGASSANRGLRATATAAQNYINCVQQYATWDTASGLTFTHWQLQGLVVYTPTDQVDGVVRVVLSDATGSIHGRVVIWVAGPLGIGPVVVRASMTC